MQQSSAINRKELQWPHHRRRPWPHVRKEAKPRSWPPKLADKNQISCNPGLGHEISLGGDKYVTIQSPVIAASSASKLKSTELQVSVAQVGNGYPIKPGLHLQQGWKGLRGQGAGPLESTPE